MLAWMQAFWLANGGGLALIASAITIGTAFELLQGALVTGLEKRASEWWYGSSDGRSGYFPSDAVQETDEVRA